MSWQLATFALLAVVVVGGFAWYERERPSARLIALVAALAALAVAGRLVLAPVPNVVATTDIALITGYALGGPAGFAVGALAAPISNIWLGQGPWTVWQMGAWGLVGLGGAWLAALSGRRLGRLGLALACGIAGLAYGALLDFSVMATYGGEQSLDRYLALSARGVPFNVAHAVGNFAIALAAGPALVRMISRYRTRLDFLWHPAPSTPVALAALALAVAAFAVPSRSQAVAASAEQATVAKSSAVASTRSWLARSQNSDGGFAASPDFPSSPSMTGWVMLALEAAGRNPLDLRKRGESPVSYLRSRIDRLRSVGDLERTILAVDGAGIDPRRFGGVDLVAELGAHRDRDGSVNGEVNLTSFYVLAMRAAGLDAGDLGRSANWLRDAQNRDGGWGFRPDAPSDPDTTGAALQAIAASGSGGKTSAEAVRWLRKVQRSGGFGLATTGVVNSQSTSWAVQGLVAAGVRGKPLNAALRYLDGLRSTDGHYRYSRSSDQTPVWVTAQAVLAVERQPLPVAPVARAPRRQPDRPSGSAANDSAGGGGSGSPGGAAQAGGGSRSSVGSAGAGRADGGDRNSGRSSGRANGPAEHRERADDGSASTASKPSRQPADESASAALDALADASVAARAPAGELGEQDDGSPAPYVAAGLGLLALAVGASLLWRRRRSS